MFKHDGQRWLIGVALGASVGAACSGADREFPDAEGAAGSPDATAGTAGRGGSAGSPPTSVGGSGTAGESTSSSAGEAGAPTETDPCGDSVCLNGGSCEDSGTVFSCDCLDGFEGDRCERNIDDCSPNPCANAGKCRDGVDSFSCDCTAGLSGDTCELLLFEPLPMLEGANGCRLEALSGNGNVAVGTCWDDAGEKAFWWKPSLGTQALPANGAISEAFAVSRDGTVVVGRQQALGQPSVGTRWVNGQAGQSYPGFTYDDERRSGRATAVADDGLTLFGQSEASNDAPRGITWKNYEPTLLGSRGGEVYVLAASGDGKVVVGYSNDPSAAIRWTLATGWISLPTGTTGADTGHGRGISRDGNVVVGSVGPQAVRWVGTDEPEPLGIQGTGVSANEDGSVIVGSSGTAAMVWTKTTGALLVADELYELYPNAAPGWTLTSADAVSADGKIIAGNGKHGDVERAWIARLP